jgi:uncharacterized SAM-binding protein YcdF (DUF218 family)
MNSAPAPRTRIQPCCRGDVPRRAPQRGGIILKLLALLLLLVLIAGVYLFRQPILRTIGGWLVVDEAPQASDAIVLLSDDTYLAERAARAAELYHQRWAPRVVASGRYLRPYASIAQLMQKDLADRSVSGDAIVPLPHMAANTREEAYVVRELVRRQRWNRILVVTSNYHTRRARLIFRRVLDPSTELRVIAAHDSSFETDRWWRSRAGLKVMFLEIVGLGVALWETSGEEPAAPPAPASPPR